MVAPVLDHLLPSPKSPLSHLPLVAGTFKEILMVASDTTKKEVARSFNLITSKMDDSWGAKKLPTAHVKDYMRRFCNQLGLKHQDVVIAEEFALAACPRDGRCPPLQFPSLTFHDNAFKAAARATHPLAKNASRLLRAWRSYIMVDVRNYT